MTTVLLAALLVGAALVQVTAGPALAVAGAEPNFVLALVAARAWLGGAAAALWPAVLGGLLLDLAAGGPIGIHALALASAALAAGRLAERSLQGHAILSALAAPPAVIVYSAFVLAAAWLLRQPLPSAQAAELGIAAGCGIEAVLCLAAVLLLGRRTVLAA